MPTRRPYLWTGARDECKSESGKCGENESHQQRKMELSKAAVPFGRWLQAVSSRRVFAECCSLSRIGISLSAESVSAKRHDSNVLAPGAQLGRCAFEMPHACIHHFCNGPKQQGQERCLKLLRGGCPRACENCKQLNLVCRCHGSSQIHLRPVHGRDTFGWLPPRPNRQRSSSAALLQEVVIPRAPGNMHSSLLWVRAVQTPLDLRETDSGEKDKDNPTTNKTKPTTAQTETPPPSGTAGSISSVLE